MKTPRLPKTLKFKVAFHLAIGLTAAVAIFTVAIVRHHRTHLLSDAADLVSQLSAVITKSTRYAMLQNQRESVYRIVQNVGAQERIERVRILSKNGVIVHSTEGADVAMKVDRSSGGCVLCHTDDKPPPHDVTERSWMYDDREGNRFLGHIAVILNDPTCSNNVLCHAHAETDRLLGMLEISYSLDKVEATMRTDTIVLIGFSVGLVLVASLFAGLFVHRMVYVPLIDLEKGSKRLSSGDLTQLIPVRSRDEFGHLASSFNSMMLALRNSELELQEWNRTLEEKVSEKTRELHLAEAKAVHAEKLASVGLLAAGIAHELNNPLTGILTFSHLLRRKVSDGSPEAEDLDLVIRETKRCSGIIKRLLDFAREKKPERRFIDVNQLLAETEQIVHHPVSFRDIELSLDLDGKVPPLSLDPDQMKQVFMNIIVNARDAIEEKGRVTIRSRYLEPGQGDSRRTAPCVEISVSDTGSGIPPEQLQKIFDPFFTTKDIGKGTGLGLSVSYGIVRAHGGTIEVESTVGKGTTFRIIIPVEAQAAEMTPVQHGEQNTGS